MRDSLSILDQAIAFSQGKVSVEKVIQMLGTIDDEILFKIIECLIAQNGAVLNTIAKEMDANNISFEGALNDLAKLFHELTICKIVPDHLKNSSKKDLYQKLADELTAESLQLFYQICIHGKKDLYLAPDPITGFNMTLLRMLAFYPTSNLAIPSKENILDHQGFRHWQNPSQRLPPSCHLRFSLDGIQAILSSEWPLIYGSVSRGRGKCHEMSFFF